MHSGVAKWQGNILRNVSVSDFIIVQTPWNVRTDIQWYRSVTNMRPAESGNAECVRLCWQNTACGFTMSLFSEQRSVEKSCTGNRSLVVMTEHHGLLLPSSTAGAVSQHHHKCVRDAQTPAWGWLWPHQVIGFLSSIGTCRTSGVRHSCFCRKALKPGFQRYRVGMTFTLNSFLSRYNKWGNYLKFQEHSKSWSSFMVKSCGASFHGCAFVCLFALEALEMQRGNWKAEWRHSLSQWHLSMHTKDCAWCFTHSKQHRIHTTEEWRALCIEEAEAQFFPTSGDVLTTIINTGNRRSPGLTLLRKRSDLNTIAQNSGCKWLLRKMAVPW
jgi:hypothetical protein